MDNREADLDELLDLTRALRGFNDGDLTIAAFTDDDLAPLPREGSIADAVISLIERRCEELRERLIAPPALVIEN